MITEYDVRVRRPWGPSVKKGQVITVNARRKVQLVRGGFAELVSEVVDIDPEPETTAPEFPKKKARKKAAKKS